MTSATVKTRLVKLIVGLALLSALAAFFMSGYAPPGLFGDVLRHNQAHQIDASPLFYSEVEHMAELEEGARAICLSRQTSRAERRKP